MKVIAVIASVLIGCSLAYQGCPQGAIGWFFLSTALAAKK